MVCRYMLHLARSENASALSAIATRLTKRKHIPAGSEILKFIGHACGHCMKSCFTRLEEACSKYTSLSAAVSLIPQLSGLCGRVPGVYKQSIMLALYLVMFSLCGDTAMIEVARLDMWYS